MSRQDDEMHTLEERLTKVQDKLDTTEKDYTDMERKYQQILEEKSILAEQLQAEAELSAEAEEVRIGKGKGEGGEGRFRYMEHKVSESGEEHYPVRRNTG